MEIKDYMEQLGSNFSNFKSDIQAQLDDLNKKANRPSLGNDQAVVSSPEEVKTFEKLLRGHISPYEAKSLVGGTDSTGGYAVPYSLAASIRELMVKFSPVRGLANVETISSDFSRYTVPVVDVTGFASGYVSETGARPATNTPTFYAPSFNSAEIYANPFITQQMLDDGSFNVGAWIARSVARTFAVTENESFINGTAANEPAGILAHTFTNEADSARAYGSLQYVPSGAAGAFAASSPHEALIDLVYAVQPAYRMNATWMMNSNTLAEVRKMVDGDGNLIWQPSLMAGQPSMLMGYPVVEDQDVPDIAADSLSIIFGDFKSYTVLDHSRGTSVLVDPYSNKPYVGYYVTKRTSGAMVDTNGIKALKFAAS